MKIIFLKDVKNQGMKDDIKEVKDGYAKFLVSQGLAVLYTSGSASVLNKEIEARKKKEEELINDYKKIKEKLEKLNIVFPVKTGKDDRMFGSISSKQISDKLITLGFEIDKKKININHEINTIGFHEIDIILHKKVKAIIKINVVKE